MPFKATILSRHHFVKSLRHWCQSKRKYDI
jgi:hypothetical protein